MENNNNTTEPVSLERYYEIVKKFVLYPGTLDELNQIEPDKDNYKIILQPGAKQYIKGYVFPSNEEIDHKMQLSNNIAEIIYDNLPFTDQYRLKPTIKILGLEFDGNIAPDLTARDILSFYHEIGMMDEDIRIKAKKIGAEGLIHFNPISNKDIPYYSGVPVKRNK